MLLGAIALIPLLGPPGEHERPLAKIGECDPRDGVKPIWTREMRREVRRDVQAACKAAEAAPIVCAYADAIVVRESAGRAGVWHELGRNELGLGAMGLSLRWHADKWPGKDEHPEFCKPAVSFVVAHAIMWRAVSRYKAETIAEIQSIYSGKWDCWHDPEGVRTCRPGWSRAIPGLCKRMESRGFDCHQKLPKRALGKRIPFRERRDFVASLEP